MIFLSCQVNSHHENEIPKVHKLSPGDPKYPISLNLSSAPTVPLLARALPELSAAELLAALPSTSATPGYWEPIWGTCFLLKQTFLKQVAVGAVSLGNDRAGCRVCQHEDAKIRFTCAMSGLKAMHRVGAGYLVRGPAVVQSGRQFAANLVALDLSNNCITGARLLQRTVRCCQSGDMGFPTVVSRMPRIFKAWRQMPAWPPSPKPTPALLMLLIGRRVQKRCCCYLGG